jgi:hypothetical protein
MIYFHHCASEHFPKYSYGFPLAQVMSCHTELGGTGEQQQQQTRQLSPSATGMENSEQAGEISGLKHFETHIVAACRRYRNKTTALPILMSTPWTRPRNRKKWAPKTERVSPKMSPKSDK